MSPAKKPVPSAMRLVGITVVVTRATEKQSSLVDPLEAEGACVLSIPTIRFASAADPAPLTEAIEGRQRFSWILFTSSTGVKYFFEAARELGVPREAWESFNFAVVGPTTASRLASIGVRARRMIIGSRAATLAELIIEDGSVGPGDRCLFPQADIARSDLQDRLATAGAEIENVVVYRTIAELPEQAEPFTHALETGEKIDAVTFASPSAYHNFLSMISPDGRRVLDERKIHLFSIGPTTSMAIQKSGLFVAGQASPHTAPGLVRALIGFFNPESRIGKEDEF